MKILSGHAAGITILSTACILVRSRARSPTSKLWHGADRLRLRELILCPTALQHQTRGLYPDGLLKAILERNRPVLGSGMQSCYIQQIKAAIVRQDPVSLNHRVAAWLASYFDILFAINGRFHPGEKRLLTYAQEFST